MREITDCFTEDCQALGLTCTTRCLEQFAQYDRLLREWNQVMNLTALTTREEIYKLHFVDSLSVCQYIDFEDKTDVRVLDVGTGAGFPGIPLKIMFPKLRLTLLDALQKRLQFLEALKTELALEGPVELLHGRAEDFANKNSSYRESFDFVLSRAVANLSTLSEYCIPYLKTGTLFVAYKSLNCSDEIRQAEHAIRVLGGEVENVRQFYLPQSKTGRCLVFVRKIKATDAAYPRKAGMPKKRPL